MCNTNTDTIFWIPTAN